MEIIKTNFDDVPEQVAGIIKHQKETVLYTVADQHCAVIGSNGGADATAIEDAGIKCVQINHEGGTIVISPGDIDIGIFTRGYGGKEYRDKLINGLLKKLTDKSYRAACVDNDILVDGKKVVGFGSRMFGDILYTAIHISVNVDLDLIQKICTKPMQKTPDGLINYQINTTDVLMLLSDVFGQDLR